MVGKFKIFSIFKHHHSINVFITGRQTDKDGRVNLWWTNQTLNKYLQGAQCFVEQYGNFTFPEFAGTEAFHVSIKNKFNRIVILPFNLWTSFPDQRNHIVRGKHSR